jgi:aspartyl-tRNA(Asn)/glutamyl-tRNA(Gln) amidotransferase subunit C
MEVNNEMVNKLAHLARLQFSTTEKEEIKSDLQKMIQFVEKLNEVDTTGIVPILHMSDGINVLRDDEIKGSIDRIAGLKNAPKQDG